MIGLLLGIYVLFYRSLLMILLLLGVLFGTVNAIAHFDNKDIPQSAYFVTIAFLSMFAYVYIVNGDNLANMTNDNVDVLNNYSQNKINDNKINSNKTNGNKVNDNRMKEEKTTQHLS